MTINVTPVLMEQLDDYSKPTFNDRILDVVRAPADSLSASEIATLLDHVFKLHVPTMIHPFPRYRELKNILEGSRAKKVHESEIRDLQALYLLTWTGPHLRRSPEIAEILRKGKGFDERDKETLFETCHRAVREVIPVYREASQRGRVEISTTPYYHPILPLLIDCEAARESRPGVDLDEVSFHFPQDARWHVEEAVRAYEARFGKRPAGMWPAEGSVSGPALDILAESGMRWAATDEAVLARSLGSFPLHEEERHRPYPYGQIIVFFRDRELSDRVGFVYSSWDPERAADDLVGRLLGIRDRLGRRERSACVSIILDGENPWEYYPDSGVGFLSRFYRSLATTPGLESVSMGDPALKEIAAPRLQRVVPGSWIDANFDTWIGEPSKNRAWKCLASARSKLAAEAPSAPLPREVYRAEGSDWFWWLGPGHDTPYEASYENLFRTNLLEAMRKLGVEPPEILKHAGRIIQSPTYQPPLYLFTPRIQGRPGNYYEWIAAGWYLPGEGSFHRSQRILGRARFGFDLERFYLRVEGQLDAIRKASEPVAVEVEFARPFPRRFRYENGKLLLESGNGTSSDSRRSVDSRGVVAVGSVVEGGFPLEEIGVKPGDSLEFAVAVRVGGETVDRLPQSGHVTVAVPPRDFGGENWSV
jgi:alpha-amylase/alpha-mannosidase (GH57 family)